ncbi:MAG: hypothetical protein WBO22_05855, partial [Shewanella indica]|uniref:hypothetical protein n=1 Tax=Shewanella indica TaxID=768528 RepID=UPI003C74DFB5
SGNAVTYIAGQPVLAETRGIDLKQQNTIFATIATLSGGFCLGATDFPKESGWLSKEASF